MTSPATAPSRLIALVFAANDPLALARFWGEALRWEVDPAGPDAVALLPSDGTRLRIAFRRDPAQKTTKNRIHLDLTTASVEDQAETVAALVELGARHVDVGQRADEPHVVLADLEGNELCIIEPQNSFLAGCGRLGSITCDGSREVGCFWSEVLGWPLVWDQHEETAIRAPDGTPFFITWGPPLPPKAARNRVHLEIAPPTGRDIGEDVDRLLALGAHRVAVESASPDGVDLADPDGNELRVVRSDHDR